MDQKNLCEYFSLKDSSLEMVGFRLEKNLVEMIEELALMCRKSKSEFIRQDLIKPRIKFLTTSRG